MILADFIQPLHFLFGQPDWEEIILGLVTGKEHSRDCYEKKR